MSDSVLPKIAAVLSNLALKRTFVLSDRLRRLVLKDGKAVFDDNFSDTNTADIVILTKEHYSEQNRTFPISSRRELTKILSLEAQNSQDILLYAIGDYIDGKRNVLCWTIQRQVFQSHQLSPLIVIPESALLLNRDENKLYSVTRLDKTFWFVKRQNDVLSAQKKGLINNVEMFLASAGINAQIERCELSEQQYLDKVTEDLAVIMLRNLKGFNPGLRQLKSIDWLSHVKFSGFAAIALLVGYFSLTSLYLNMRLDSARSVQSEYADKTKDVFMLKGQLTKIEQKHQKLAALADKLSAPNVVWRFLGPLIQKGYTVAQINLLPSGMYIIRFEAPKATDVIEVLKADPQVVEPQLRGQSIVRNGKEIFEIGFKVKREQ